nr:hypothetical protein RM5p2_00088 [Serratia proteamaculans]
MAEAGLFAELQATRFTDILLDELRDFGTGGTEEKFGIKQVIQACSGFWSVDFFHLGKVLEPQRKAATELASFGDNTWQCGQFVQRSQLIIKEPDTALPVLPHSQQAGSCDAEPHGNQGLE